MMPQCYKENEGTNFVALCSGIAISIVAVFVLSRVYPNINKDFVDIIGFIVLSIVWLGMDGLGIGRHRNKKNKCAKHYEDSN